MSDQFNASFRDLYLAARDRDRLPQDAYLARSNKTHEVKFDKPFYLVSDSDIRTILYEAVNNHECRGVVVIHSLEDRVYEELSGFWVALVVPYQEQMLIGQLTIVVHEDAQVHVYIPLFDISAVPAEKRISAEKAGEVLESFGYERKE